MIQALLSAEFIEKLKSGQFPLLFEADGNKMVVQRGKISINGQDHFLLDAISEEGRAELIQAGKNSRSVYEYAGASEFNHVGAYKTDVPVALIREHGIGTNDYKITIAPAGSYMVITGIMNLEVSLVAEEKFRSQFFIGFPQNPEQRTFAELDGKFLDVYGSPEHGAFGKRYMDYAAINLQK